MDNSRFQKYVKQLLEGKTPDVKLEVLTPAQTNLIIKIEDDFFNKRKQAVSNLFNEWHVIDTETGGLSPQNAFIHDLAIAKINKKTGELKGGSLYKLVTEKEQALSPLAKINSKVAKYVPFGSKELTASRSAAQTYGEFGMQVLKDVFDPKGTSKVVWVKNLNFESSFMQPILQGSEDKTSFFRQLAGFSAKDLETGRIGVTSYKVRSARAKQIEAQMSGNMDLYRREVINAMDYTVEAAKNAPLGKTTVLEMDDITRGVIALAQEKGLLTKTEDYVTGSASDYLYRAFGQDVFQHAALPDAAQEGKTLVSNLIGNINKIRGIKDLSKFRATNPELYKSFKTLDEMILAGGKNFSTVMNYLDTMEKFVYHGISDELKTDWKEFKTGQKLNPFIESGVEVTPDMTTYIKTGKQAETAEEITRYFKDHHGMNESLLSSDTIAKLEFAANKAKLSGDKTSSAKLISDVSTTIREAKSSVLDAVINQQAMQEAKRAVGTAAVETSADVVSSVPAKIKALIGSSEELKLATASSKGPNYLKWIGLAAGAIIGANLISSGKKDTTEKFRRDRYYENQGFMHRSFNDMKRKNRNFNLANVHTADSEPIKHYSY